MKYFLPSLLITGIILLSYGFYKEIYAANCGWIRGQVACGDDGVNPDYLEETKAGWIRGRVSTGLDSTAVDTTPVAAADSTDAGIYWFD